MLILVALQFDCRARIAEGVDASSRQSVFSVPLKFTVIEDVVVTQRLLDQQQTEFVHRSERPDIVSV